MSNILSNRFKLALLIHYDDAGEMNTGFPTVPPSANVKRVWWPCWIFDNYHQLSSLSIQYDLRNHFQDFLLASQRDGCVLQHTVAYLIDERVPGNRRLIFNPISKPMECANDDIVAHCQRYPGWLEACAEGSMRSAAPQVFDATATAPQNHGQPGPLAQQELMQASNPFMQAQPAVPMEGVSRLQVHPAAPPTAATPMLALPPAHPYLANTVLQEPFEESGAASFMPNLAQHPPSSSIAMQCITHGQGQAVAPAMPVKQSVRAPVHDLMSKVEPHRRPSAEVVILPTLQQEAAPDLTPSAGEPLTLSSAISTVVRTAGTSADCHVEMNNNASVARPTNPPADVGTAHDDTTNTSSPSRQDGSAAGVRRSSPSRQDGSADCVRRSKTHGCSKKCKRTLESPSTKKKARPKSDDVAETENPGTPPKFTQSPFSIDAIRLPQDVAAPSEPPEMYHAFFQGKLQLLKDGSHSCQGKWACTRDQLMSNAKPTCTFSFYLLRDWAKPSSIGADNTFPLDSSMYEGSFLMKEATG